jgi:hypothetical protein
MTMTMSEPIARQRMQPVLEPAPHGRRDPLDAMPTDAITLSPELLEALRRIAPKPRRRKLPYLAALLLVAVAVCVAWPQARWRALSFARSLWHRPPTTAAAPATTAAAPAGDSTAAASVVAPVPIVSNPAPSPSASVAATATTAAAQPTGGARPAKATSKTYRKSTR